MHITRTTLLVALALTAPGLAAQARRAGLPTGARVRVIVPPRVEWTTATVLAAEQELRGADVIPSPSASRREVRRSEMTSEL
jgi:hypothetical protein